MKIVLRNPIYFLFLILCAVGAYITYTLNLWGPMARMADAASKQALQESKRRLRDFLESSDTGRQAMAMSGAEDALGVRHGRGAHRRPAARRHQDDDDEMESIEMDSLRSRKGYERKEEGNGDVDME
jgi:hypothetical protein